MDRLKFLGRTNFPGRDRVQFPVQSVHWMAGAPGINEDQALVRIRSARNRPSRAIAAKAEPRDAFRERRWVINTMPKGQHSTRTSAPRTLASISVGFPIRRSLDSSDDYLSA
jgi:hypothetical protein